jgi:flagellar biosynthetic protein FliQ
VSFFQAITQINEQTLSFLPKLVGVGITAIIAGPWMMTTLVDYIQRTITSIPALVSGG